MSLGSQFEREEQYLCDELNSGAIDQAEFNKQMRELQRDFREAAEEEAQQAYDKNMGSFGY